MDAVAGLDIGSYRVVAAVSPLAPVPPHREARVARETGDGGAPAAGPAPRGLQGLSVGSAATLGMRRGQVLDAEELARSVREALSRAESAAGARAAVVCLGFSGHTVVFYRHRYGSLIGKRRVNQQDLDRINRLALVSDLPPGRRIIQAVPVEYLVDGLPVSGEPLGMYCSRLEVESVVVTADSELIDCLVRAVHGSGLNLEIRGLLPSTLAAGRVVLSEARQQLGAALVDIGGSCTSIAVYNHGYPAGFDVLPLGSGHITSDLAICLRTTLEGAEEIKRKIGLGAATAGHNEQDQKDHGRATVTFPRLSGSGYNEVPVKNVVEVVEARTCELLELIQASLKRLSGGLELPGGVTLTGGGSSLKGIVPLAGRFLSAGAGPGSTAPEVETKNPGDSLHTAGAEGLIRHWQSLYVPADDYQPPADIWRRFKDFFGLQDKSKIDSHSSFKGRIF